MLSSFRDTMTKGPAKIVTLLIMILLIGSFGIWGIEDVFRGGGSTNVASVAGTEISGEAFTEAYRRRAAQLTQATGKAMTPDLARLLGVDKQVLNAMVSDTALDVQATKLGLGLDPKSIVQAVVNDPNFQAPALPGQPPAFNAGAFRQLLQSNGLTENMFFSQQRNVYIREQMDQAFAQGGPVPLALQQAVARYSQEKRNVSYFVLPQSSLGDIGQPDQAALKSYYDEYKARFRTPEYRSFSYILITPAELAARSVVSDADVDALYQKSKGEAEKLEKRTVEQISFPTIEEARAAAARIASGQVTFEALAAERKLSPAELNLGSLSKSAISDPKIADVAFALKTGATSDAIQGSLTNVIIKVTAISSARDALRAQLESQRSSETLKNLRGSIDDARQGGTPMKDIAANLKLQAVTLGPLDREAKDQTGKKVDFPLSQQVLQNVFSADQGSDPDPVDGGDAGLMWLSLDDVIAPRDRTLDEAKADVVSAWTADQKVEKLKAKADDLVKQMNAGKTLEDMAKSLNLQVMPAWDLTRGGQNAGVPPATVNIVFATPLKAFGSSLASNGLDRIVFHVEDNVIPEFDPKSPEAMATSKQLSAAIGSDLFAEYTKKVEDDLGVTINQANVDRVIGVGGSL